MSGGRQSLLDKMEEIAEEEAELSRQSIEDDDEMEVEDDLEDEEAPAVEVAKNRQATVSTFTAEEGGEEEDEDDETGYSAQEVLDTPTPLLEDIYEYQDMELPTNDSSTWDIVDEDAVNPTTTTLSPQGSSMSALSGSETSLPSSMSSSVNRRPSYNILRNSGASEATSKSAPVVLGGGGGDGGGGTSGRDVSEGMDELEDRLLRRVTISGPSNRGQRRQELYRSVRTSGVSVPSSVSDEDSTSGGFMKSLRAKTGLASIRSTRRSVRMGNSGSTGGDRSNSVLEAVDRLGRESSGGTSAGWESVAAAAAVVAASASGTSAATKRGYHQFSAGDHVLCLLTLLNITNRDDDKDLFTIEPVNKLGYPAGQGKTDAERQGPFSYVLAMVQNVHFDEDERYYTVQRCDSGSQQRADPGWMEPLRNVDGIQAALHAAHKTAQSEAAKAHSEPSEGGCGTALSTCLSWPKRCVRYKLVPFYRHFRASLKTFCASLLHGDSGYACRMRCSAINGLVLCSFVYLFLESFSLAFLPASSDFAMAIVELVVWTILLLELVFEYMIRPDNYVELKESDKACSPSTARHINNFHLIFESLALLLFIPQFGCVAGQTCGAAVPFSNIRASVLAVAGKDAPMAAFSRLRLGLNFLKAFGLVRHWKQMWINHTFDQYNDQYIRSFIIRRLLLVEKERRLLKRRKTDDDAVTVPEEEEDISESYSKDTNEEDRRLQSAATIGTALMIVNSQRALLLLLCVVTIFPLIYTLGQQNNVAWENTKLLEANNIVSNTTNECQFLQQSVSAWLRTSAKVHVSYGLIRDEEDLIYAVWGQLLPVRCEWQRSDGVITTCPEELSELDICQQWSDTGVRNDTSPDDTGWATVDYFADALGVRGGGLRDFQLNTTASADFGDGLTEVPYYVKVIYNQNHTVALTQTSLVLFLLSMLILVLVGLTVMRSDAGRLVLDPLQRMLKIVVRYAENPLQSVSGKKSGDNTSNDGGDREQLGNYETEQLINAISKIADLLRKCWGVAGAGIISSNLARTKDGKTVVFNPTVPGKRVYALFGFVAVNDFGTLLRALDRDVMILINDVARVVHDETYRWSLGGSGQCNKNLGSAFLMVFRIGDFMEVHDKKKRATDVVFNSQMKKVKVRRRQTANSKRRGGGSRSKGRTGSSQRFDLGNDDTLQLASLPGIQSFTDRALIGFLKSYASIHRDKKLQNWKKDFRLGAGVGAFDVSVIFGMDAGWAVEGAVGSEYKIDATYLSPHVNMASRMMSATKQYGVTILLSQAVEELLSKPARTKLRHLDTVYVKGSSVEQRIFTYDARCEGVDFFLYARSDEQADLDAAAYAPTIWDTDQDLRAMRQHITDDFTLKFKTGVDQYLAGNWKAAIETLRDADDLMIQCILEEGYVDHKLDDLDGQLFDRMATNEEITRIRNEFGDGACKNLVQYMSRRKGVPPPDWHGVRHLMSK